MSCAISCRRWYCGVISDYDPKDNKHLVHYDDNNDEWLLLKDEVCHIFSSREEEESLEGYAVRGKCFCCQRVGRLAKPPAVLPVPAASALPPPAAAPAPAPAIAPSGPDKAVELKRERDAEMPAADVEPDAKRPRSAAEGSTLAVDVTDKEASAAPAAITERPPPVDGTGEQPPPDAQTMDVDQAPAAAPAAAPADAANDAADGSREYCTKCGGGESLAGDEILLCDGLGCTRNYHQQCHEPPVAAVPEDAWLCQTCVANGNEVDPQALVDMEKGDMLQCGACHDRFHFSCLDKPLESRPDLWPTWRCLTCKVCGGGDKEKGLGNGCGKTGEKIRLAICDVCDIGYHIGCLDPPLKSWPARGFKCPACVKCSSCGTTSAKAWASGYDMCQPCAVLFRQKKYCPICLVTHRAGEPEQIYCNSCKFWVHARCDGLDSKAFAQLSQQDEEYSCPNCRGERTTTLMLQVLEMMQKEDREKFFAEPVTVEYALATQYHSVVPPDEAMDFATMKRKVEGGEYGSTLQPAVTAFRQDFEAVCNNAMAFHRPNEPCHIKAKRMQKFGRGLLQTTFPHIFAAEDIAAGGKDGTQDKGKDPADAKAAGDDTKQKPPQQQVGDEEVTTEAEAPLEISVWGHAAAVSFEVRAAEGTDCSSSKLTPPPPHCLVCGGEPVAGSLLASEAELLTCSVCAESYHAFCTPPPCPDVNEETRLNWQCPRCRTCANPKCGAGIDAEAETPEVTTRCAVCDKAVHNACLSQAMREGRDGCEYWVCQECRCCHGCGTRTARQWSADGVWCSTCAAAGFDGRYCGVCARVYDSTSPEASDMVQCDRCALWVHVDCDGMDEATYKAYEDGDPGYEFYSCPDCRLDDASANDVATWRVMARLVAKIQQKRIQFSADLLPQAASNNGLGAGLTTHARRRAAVIRWAYERSLAAAEPQALKARGGGDKAVAMDVEVEAAPCKLEALDASAGEAPTPRADDDKDSFVDFSDDEAEMGLVPVPPPGTSGAPAAPPKHEPLPSLNAAASAAALPAETPVSVREPAEAAPMDASQPAATAGNGPTRSVSGVDELTAAVPEDGRPANGHVGEATETASDATPMEVDGASSTTPDTAPSDKADTPPLAVPNSAGEASAEDSGGSVKREIGALNGPLAAAGDDASALVCSDGATSGGGSAPAGQRVCSFCGDTDAAVICGRMVPIGTLAWAHVNCLLWSSEVFEKEPGVVSQVVPALRRARRTFCSHCQMPGASVGCNAKKCTNVYHFACARAAGVSYVLDSASTTYCCAEHVPPRMRGLPLPLRVDRSVRVKHQQRLHDVKRWPQAVGSAQKAVMTVGALRVYQLGRPQPRRPQFHSRHAIFPLGFESRRRYHDVAVAHAICDYACEVRDAAGLPAFIITRIDKASAAGADASNGAVAEPTPPSTPSSVAVATAAASSAGPAPLSFRGRTPEEAWSALQARRCKLLHVRPPVLSERRTQLEAYLFFGFGVPAVAQLIEQLPGAKACEGFQPRFSQAGDMQRVPPLPKSASGCARADPVVRRSSKFKHDRTIYFRPFINRGALPAERRVAMDSAADAAFADELEKDGRVALRRREGERPLGQVERGLPPALRTAANAVEVRRSAIHNWGLFTTRPVPKDGMVVEYMGVAIRSVMADLREKEYENGTAKGQGGDCYMFRLDDDVVLDATTRGNVARYMNHCCSPNCYSRVIEVDGSKHIVIFAMRDLEESEEITYDYKFAVEREKIACYCGSPKCLGVMN